jgi:hypothetical protein
MKGLEIVKSFCFISPDLEAHALKLQQGVSLLSDDDVVLTGLLFSVHSLVDITGDSLSPLT